MLRLKQWLVHGLVFFCLILVGCGESVPLKSNVVVKPPTDFAKNSDIECSGQACTIILTWATIPGVTYDLYWLMTVGSAGGDPLTGTRIQNVKSPYTHIRPPNRTIRYVLTAGIGSAISLEKTAVKIVLTPGPPDKPAGFTVTPGDSKIIVNWRAEPKLTYQLSWSNTQGVFDPRDDITMEEPPPYTHERLTNGLPYYYKLRAINAKQQTSKDTGIKQATPTVSNDLKAPLMQEPTALDGQIELAWDTVSGAVKYRVYWLVDTPQTNPASLRDLSLAATPPQFDTVETNRFTQVGAENESTYYYTVTAISATDAEGNPASVVSATPKVGTEPPPPLNVIATGGDGEVILQWEGVTDAIFNIYWSTDATVTSLSGQPIDDKTSPYIHKVDNGNTYYYVITATVNGLTSVDSERESAEAEAGSVMTPAPPTGFDLIAQDGEVRVTWDMVPGATQYNLYYSDVDGFNLAPGEKKSNVQSPYVVSNLTNDVTYYFRLTSENNSGESPPTAQKSATPTANNGGGADVLRGGRLYDAWWSEKGEVAPSGSHPLWENRAKFIDKVVNQQSGASTWACRTCHGWDYQGAQGAYGVTSPFYTGFKGLAGAAATMDLTDIATFIRSGMTPAGQSHAFDNYLAAEDINDIALFIKNEVSNLQYSWEGDISRGEAVYTSDTANSSGTACNASGCHGGSEDSVINFAIYQPERFIHVVRFGVEDFMPGGPSLADAKAVLAYVWTQLVVGDTSSNFSAQDYNAVKDKVGLGGRLYDRWWQDIQQRESTFPVPEGSHPLWSNVVAAVNGQETWRCKECHGWDYQGKEGAYGRTSSAHYSGVGTSIIPLDEVGLKYTGAKSIYEFLRNGGADGLHAFKTVLSDESLYQLTGFIELIRREASSGSAPGLLLNDKDEPASADIAQGQALYDGDAACGRGSCHAKNGKRVAFKDRDPDRGEIQFVDTIAKSNPWEFIHKTRYGHPASRMKGAVEHTTKADVIGTLPAAMDMLAYSQTQLLPDLMRGGRIYDTWWSEQDPGSSGPTDNHPLWPADNNNMTGDQTWRCVACHGWDYKGSAGAKGVLNITQADVGAFIQMGTVQNADDHAFQAVLKNQDISDLTAFITQSDKGVTDVDNAILAGDSAQGDTLYHDQTPEDDKKLGNCITCHGEGGTSIPNVDLVTLADQAPYRVMHSIRFGQPGSIMVPTLTGFTGLEVDQAGHVLAFVKTLTGAPPAPDPDPDPSFSYNYANANPERGGRLYDNWWLEMQVSDAAVQVPSTVNPFWDKRDAINVPDLPQVADTWRCMSCHGDDYLGIGFLLSNRQADNLLDKLEQRKSQFGGDMAQLQDYIYNWIQVGTNNEHNFGESSELPTVLSERELWDLTRFVVEATLSTVEYIYATTGEVINNFVDPVNGKQLYDGSKVASIDCQSCHGADGQTLPPASDKQALDIFAIARENPWRFIHVVRFGLSSTAMPAVIGIGEVTTQDVFDLTAYVQQAYEIRLGIR